MGHTVTVIKVNGQEKANGVNRANYDLAASQLLKKYPACSKG